MNEPKILSEVFEKIKKYLHQNKDTTKEVVKFRTAQELSKEIDFPIEQKAVSEQEFLKLLDKYLEFSVQTGSKQFLNQLFSGFNFPAFIGEVFTTLANTSMYTYEVAPVATLIEVEMIKLMRSYAGFDKGDGIFLTGGSNANLVAMFSARNQVFPEGRLQGYDKELKLTAFVNQHAHYSFGTAANVLGIGTKNVIKVKADKEGKLIPEELEKEIKNSIERGEKPFFVAATCATTMSGAYDPIDKMAAICQKHNIWLHADGSFGGSLILSDKHRGLFKGIEKADSFAWNPHKLMNIPLICSVLLFKKYGVLQHNITDINTDYIFHDIDLVEDLGKKSIQCGRKVDAVKLWFAWKYFGLEGYQKRIDTLIEMATYAEKKVKQIPELELVVERQSFTVCFRYRSKNHSDLNKFNLKLRECLRKKGKTIVNYGYFDGELAIRLVATNGELQKSDIDLFFDYLMLEAGELEEKFNTTLCG